MEENKSLNNKPLYRFFNVVLFVAYSLVFLAAIVATIIGYGEREIISANVICRDGTSWNALEPKNILYDSYAKCGLCTKRTSSGSYVECTYKDVDYDSFETKETREVWSWSTIAYPAIVLGLGLGVVDFFRIAVVYVFTGKKDLEKSVLLKLVKSFFET